MRTIPHPSGPDVVLDEIETDDGPRVRIRRRLVFLCPVEARRLSAVSAPAVGEVFGALKHDERHPFDTEPSPGHTVVASEKTSGGNEMDEKERAAIVEEAQTGFLTRLVSGLKQAFGAIPELPPESTESPAEPVDAAKYYGSITFTSGTETIAQVMTMREISSEFWELQRAFDSIVERAMFEMEFAGDRSAAVAQALTDFGSAVTGLLARRMVSGMKAVEPTEGEDMSVDDKVAKGAREMRDTAKRVSLEAVKAGKVLSSTNLDRLMRAASAIAEILGAAAPPDVAPGEKVAPDGEETDATKVPKPGTTGGVAPGKKAEDTNPAPPAEGADEEQVMDTTKQADVLKALEAAKSAKTPEELASALKLAEQALKGEEPSEVAALKAEVDAQFGEMTTVLGSLVETIKALPGLTYPGNVDPNGDRIGGEAFRSAMTEEQVLRGGNAAFVGPANPPILSGPTVSVPANSSIPVARPAMKSEGDALLEQFTALKAQVAMLASTVPASKAAQPSNGSGGSSSWGSGDMVK